ncbi:MAG TPA: reverse transcriptase family protein [Phycisphaerae bacterium]|nr:reverse transcriptase family protein [Phycisphaerae bacterium]
MRFDRRRFLYAVAGELLAGAWTAVGLEETLGRALAGMRILRLRQRLVQAFPQRPGFHELVTFLGGDAALHGALRWGIRVTTGKITRVRQLRGVMEGRPARLAGVDLPALATEGALAAWLGVTVPRLQWLADATGRNRRQAEGPLRNYRYRWIARRAAKREAAPPPRLLEIPKATLKAMQRQILEQILQRVPAHAAAHGFVPGRSPVTNAAAHCGKAVVLRMDLQDFFASVAAARVFRLFRTLGYSATVSRLLMGLCTTMMPADVWERRPRRAADGGEDDGGDFLRRQRLITRHLPQGAPTSPALANLAAMRLDRRLSRLAAAAGGREGGVHYTRYADDLTFSAGRRFGRSMQRLRVLIDVIAREEGFVVNQRKTRVMRAGVRQRVAGVVVNVRPNVERRAYERLKALLTNCVRHGAASQNRAGVKDFRAHVLGRVAQVAGVHAARGAKLRALAARVRWED